MNGNPSAHISEHAFGNALDIAASRSPTAPHLGQGRLEGHAGRAGFSARRAGRRLPAVQHRGWRRASNVYHYDHIHVD